jgi:pimeloyl-ACP methyl ester carboxylesterase
VTTNQEPHTGHRVVVHGLDMFYREAGEGQALVLLHGGTRTSGDWLDELPALARHFHVLAPDSRGHGRTDNPHGTLSYPMMADDVASFILALGLEKPLVLGYSDGGQIALELGLRHPAVPGALVIGGARHTFGADYFEELREWGFDGPGKFDVSRMQFPEFDLAASAREQHIRPDDPDYWLTLLDQISRLWYSVQDYSPDQLAAITAPTLVFVGDRDAENPVEVNVGMYRCLPRAELLVVPNATHFSAAAELFNPVVLNFLQRHTPTVTVAS